MSKKHHGGPAPVPPGNRPQSGPPSNDTDLPGGGSPQTPEAGFQEQDPERRLGNFEQKGEHSRQQPGRLNDGDVHSQ